MPLIKNTAFTAFSFAMYDGNGAPKTGLTVTAQRSLDGAAFAACANSPTELASGFYLITLAAADLNADVVGLRFTAPGADPTLITVFPTNYGFDRNVKTSWDVLGPVSWNGRNFSFAAAGAVAFVPFTVTRRFVATRMLISNGITANGNTTAGIYDVATTPTLLRATAATAMSGTSTSQIINLTSVLVLNPGAYQMALSNSGTLGEYGNLVGLVAELGAIIGGVRAAAGGGIVTAPTLVDPTSAHFTAGAWPAMAVLGFASNEAMA